MLDRGPDALGVALVDVDRADSGHAVDVAAGGKHLVAAGEQDATHRGVDGQLGKILREQGLQFQAEGVGGLRAVESEQGHAGRRALQQHR
ncbi:hypothetical protein FQZ97_1148600 [compost metagenome]